MYKQIKYIEKKEKKCHTNQRQWNQLYVKVRFRGKDLRKHLLGMKWQGGPLCKKKKKKKSLGKTGLGVAGVSLQIKLGYVQNKKC